MLTKHDKEVISDCARRYGASSVLLFGSSIGKKSSPNDIDLAVKGIKPSLFFRFYAELIKGLSKPVDVIYLSEKTLFNRIVEKEGVRIYG